MQETLLNDVRVICVTGQDVVTTWGLLDATAAAGATSIVVQGELTEWQVGDSIVIASTGLEDEGLRENEEHVISAISTSGGTTTITLTVSSNSLYI